MAYFSFIPKGPVQFDEPNDPSLVESVHTTKGYKSDVEFG